MDKTVVFAFKGAGYGNEIEAANGVFEYNSFSDYYRKFACKILNLKPPPAKDPLPISFKTKDFLKGKFQGFDQKRDSVFGMDLFNKNVLKEIDNA